MRLGRNFHQHQVLGWEGCYIRYAYLKRLLKQCQLDPDQSQPGRPWQVLHECIKEDFQFVIDFCSKETQAIREVVQKTLAVIQDQPVSWDGNPDHFPWADKNNAFDRLAYEIAAACNRLQWYAKLNFDAFIHLRTKISKIQPLVPQQLWALTLDAHFFVASKEIRQLIKHVEQYIRDPNDEFSQWLEERSSKNVFCHPIRHSISYQVHWAEYGKDLSVTHQTLLKAWRQGDAFTLGDKTKRGFHFDAWSALLVPVVRSGDLDSLKALLPKADVKYQNNRGETAMHVAAREGLSQQLRSLLTIPRGVAGLDLAESQCGWTALMLACTYGHAQIVEALLAYGADANLTDAQGWTAKEHASFRGHLQIAKIFQENGRSNRPLGDLRDLPLARPLQLPLLSRPDEHVVFLWLGAANIRSSSKPVDFFDLAKDASKPLADVGYSLELRPFDVTLDLPRTDYAINSPWMFSTDEPESTSLLFNLRKIREDLGKDLVGCAVATISTLTQGHHSEGRESLVRDYTLPILEWETQFLLGTVTFSLLVAHPYTQPRSDLCKQVTHRFWKPGGFTQVVGHRGSGANTTAKTNLQIGENTLHSLESAIALGAVGVEFDVQLTKDFVPVIYHNFLVMETGGETVLWNLSRDQFVHLSESQSSEGSVASGAETRYNARNGQIRARPRSRSLDIYDDHRITDMVERMKHTTEATNKGIKGNMRGMAIQSLFPAFEDLLRKLAESIAFDVELKYPMLWESQDQDWEPFSTEANLFLDTILALIYKYGGRRNITFSSFSPELCILMSLKQKDYPILFINKVGSVPVGDIRASSFQQACAFAKAWGLAGIVVLSDPIVMCPRLIGYAKSKGLVCVSYGDLNDVPEFAVRQAEAGLDAIIVNKVRLVRKTLDEWEEKRGEKKEEEVESEEGSSDGEFEDAE